MVAHYILFGLNSTVNKIEASANFEGLNKWKAFKYRCQRMFGDTKESSKTEDIYYDLRFENPCIGES